MHLKPVYACHKRSPACWTHNSPSPAAAGGGDTFGVRLTCCSHQGICQDSGEGQSAPRAAWRLRAHSPWPCTRGSASPAGAGRCHTSYHTLCTWRSQAGFPPATGEAWRSADQEETYSRATQEPGTEARKPLGQCAKINSAKTFLLLQAEGGQGLCHRQSTVRTTAPAPGTA